MNKLKIAIVSPMVLPCPAISGGAVEMLTQYLAEESSKENEVDLYTKNNKKLEKYKYDNINLIQIKISNIKKNLQKIYDKVNYKIFKGNLKFYSFIDKKVAKQIAKKDYDYIVVENEMVLYRYIYKYNKRAKLIYHMHNDFYAKNRTPKYYSIISKTAYKVLTVSKYLEKRCLEIQNRPNIEVFYNCIDENIYNFENRENFRKKFGIKNDEIVIGFAGRTIPEKGILELIKAFKMLNSNKKLKLLIVGTNVFTNLKKDKYLQKIFHDISEIKDHIIFSGFIETKFMPMIYNTMDILVIPSMWEEPFGCVAIEGMAMGVPIVATKSGGLSEIVTENNGFLVEKNDNVVNNIYEKLKLLIDDENLRNKISKNTQEYFKSHKEFHKCQYYNNFKKCINNRG